MCDHQERRALISNAEENQREQKLTVFSVRLLYYEFMSDFNSGAKNDEEMAGLEEYVHDR